MKPGDLVGGRYEIARELGRGGAGATYLARDAQTGADAVVKILHLDLLHDWKAVELFEREASVLKALHHERIPSYVDSFRADVEGSVRFVLVRQYVEGASLQARIESGWRATEEEIRQLGARLLAIVEYIHSVRPPVIHRDINPRNIIQRADGEVFLVDFGGVQDAIRVSGSASSTIIGTPGYTPLEQFVGRATVRSDLYAVAATLLFMLTHRNPTDLPTRDMKIDFRAALDISSPGLTRLLASWLEPDEAKRTLSVKDAIALLQGREPEASHSEPAAEITPPHGSRLAVDTRGGGLRIEIPERGIGASRYGGFAIVWLGILGFWTYSAIFAGAPLSFRMVSLPFWGVGLLMVWRVVYRMFGRVGIEIGEEGLTFFRSFLFLRRREKVPLAEVGPVVMEGGRMRRSRHMHMGPPFPSGAYGSRRGGLLMDLGARSVRFGENLSQREQEWLRDTINAEVKRRARRS